MITCVVKNAATKNHQVSSVTDNSYHNCMDHSNGLPFWVCAAQAVQPGPSDLYLELVLKRIAKSVFVRRLLLPFLWGGPWESSETKWATWWELPGKDLPIAGIRRCLSTVVFFFFFVWRHYRGTSRRCEAICFKRRLVLEAYLESAIFAEDSPSVGDDSLLFVQQSCLRFVSLNFLFDAAKSCVLPIMVRYELSDDMPSASAP